MVYKFKCDVKASDLWKLSMYTTYHSFLGVCNIVFAVAMFLLAFRFFGHSTWVVRIILIGLCMIFPVFQPLGTYGYACRQLEWVKVRVIQQDGLHLLHQVEFSSKTKGGSIK